MRNGAALNQHKSRCDWYTTSCYAAVCFIKVIFPTHEFCVNTFYTWRLLAGWIEKRLWVRCRNRRHWFPCLIHTDVNTSHSVQMRSVDSVETKGNLCFTVIEIGPLILFNWKLVQLYGFITRMHNISRIVYIKQHSVLANVIAKCWLNLKTKNCPFVHDETLSVHGILEMESCDSRSLIFQPRSGIDVLHSLETRNIPSCAGLCDKLYTFTMCRWHFVRTHPISLFLKNAITDYKFTVKVDSRF